MKNMTEFGIHEFLNFSHQPSLMKPAMVQMYAWLAELPAWVPTHKNIAEYAWHLNRHLNHAWHKCARAESRHENTSTVWGLMY